MPYFHHAPYSYCPAIESNYTLCPEGFYGATPGLSSSSCSGPCPPSYYCPPGSTAIGTATQTITASQTVSPTQSSTATQSSSMTQTPSQTSSGSRSPSQTGSQSPSVSSSQSPTASLTPSQSATASSSPSGTRSPSSTATSSPSRSQLSTGTTSSTESQAPTRTPTRTQTPSQTTSGFLEQPVIDNTALLRNGILTSSSEPLSATLRFGVVLNWPETDPTCGPGSYNLTSISECRHQRVPKLTSTAAMTLSTPLPPCSQVSRLLLASRAQRRRWSMNFGRQVA